MAHTKKTKTLSMRLHDEQHERIMTAAHSNNMSASEFVVLLMNHYETKQNELSKETPITLTMFRRRETSEGVTQTPLKKISFRGSVSFQPEHWYSKPMDEITAKHLREDFGFDDYESWIYTFFHALSLYYHIEKNSYIVQERIWVQLAQEYHSYTEAGAASRPLVVDRCKFVSDYAELYEAFHRYADPHNLECIGHIMAEDIGTNYELMDELF